MGWKRGLRISLGIGLVFIGIFIILTARIITGAVIGFQPYNYLGLLGILVFIIGVFLIVASGIGERLEEKLGESIRVYESGPRKTEEERRYFMSDPEGFFTIQGNISLKDFKDMYKVIKDDPELLNRARDVYGAGLLEISSKRGHNADIAREFLEVLYGGKIPRQERQEYRLAKEEKEKIKNAFSVGWHTNFNAVQREVLKEYNLGYGITRGNHIEVYSLENPSLRITTGLTPSDYRVGIKFSGDLIHFIERAQKLKKKSEKK